MGSWEVIQPVSWRTVEKKFLCFTHFGYEVRMRHRQTGEVRWRPIHRDDLSGHCLD